MTCPSGLRLPICSDLRDSQRVDVPGRVYTSAVRGWFDNPRPALSARVPMSDFLAFYGEDKANSLFDRVGDVCSASEPFGAAAPLR
jgi:hypothetical protein